MADSTTGKASTGLVWLITGCTSGFGLALAHYALSKNHKVIATARDPSKLKSLASAGATTLALDVTWPFERLEAAIAQAKEAYGRIDVLVNNAGYSILGAAETLPPARNAEQFAVCYFGPVNLTQLVLPGMRSRGFGVILNISSIAGQSPLPACSLYTAAKGAIENWSESLAAEVKSFGIRVHIICPGTFRTNFLSEQQTGRSGGSVIEDLGDPAYGKGPVADVISKFRSMEGRQPGDVDKAVKAMWEIATEEGEIGQTVKNGDFFRVNFGEDCVGRVQARVDDLQRTLDGQPFAKHMAYE